MNRSDSEAILGIVSKSGHEVASCLGNADLVIVNTCSVKRTTHRKMLRRLKELKNLNGKRIVVAGCLPLIDLKALDRLGTFDGIISCKSISKLDEVLNQILKGESDVRVLTDDREKTSGGPKLRSSSVGAVIPISEGCNSSCSYCSVKFARGDLESFPLDKLIAETKAALEAGFREMLLTSQDTAAYGLDCGASLPELLNEITSITGNFRVRVGMMNPKNVLPILPELVDSFENEKVYKFLHLPVQSGDDGILQAMKRGYGVKEFLKIVETFRKKIPELFISTDLIVGFPGEGEDEFANTFKLMRDVEPENTNVSRFSPMPRTAASKMPQVNGREVAARSRRISKLCREISLKKSNNYVGKCVEGFVTERGKNGRLLLRSGSYRKVVVKDGMLGEFRRAKITRVSLTHMRGETI